ncbi:MAG: hypothetical protein NE330_18415 [Lentisphaeraceae bacterium]|nr:hypothetical protein [Lentisphaeraceae bacterium]
MRKVLILVSLVASSVFLLVNAIADLKEKQHGHEHHKHANAAEMKKNSDKKVNFFVQDVAKKTVNITVVAAYNGVNYGMNFNGYAKGASSYKIPTGWTVKVRFENWSPVPHSLVIVEEDMVSRPQVGEAYFEGANSPDPTLATAPKEADFSFVVDEPGDFAFACGFPAHSANGQWIKLEVSDDYKKAEFVVPKK